MFTPYTPSKHRQDETLNLWLMHLGDVGCEKFRQYVSGFPVSGSGVSWAR